MRKFDVSVNLQKFTQMIWKLENMNNNNLSVKQFSIIIFEQLY